MDLWWARWKQGNSLVYQFSRSSGRWFWVGLGGWWQMKWRKVKRLKGHFGGRTETSSEGFLQVMEERTVPRMPSRFLACCEGFCAEGGHLSQLDSLSWKKRGGHVGGSGQRWDIWCTANADRHVHPRARGGQATANRETDTRSGWPAKT